METNAISELQGRLQRYPDVKFEVMDQRLHVHRPTETGFDIEVAWDRAPDHWIVSLGGGPLHVHCETGEETVELVGMALCDRCRLKEIMRGSLPVAAALEVLDGAVWRERHRVGLLISPFWRKRTERTLQNRVIVHRPDPPAAEAQ